MRTTVRIDDALLTEAKKLAAETGRTLTAVLEDALREVLSRRKQSGRRSRLRLTTYRGRGLQPGVDLDEWASLLDRMESTHVSDRR
jgi:hypothetical protein